MARKIKPGEFVRTNSRIRKSHDEYIKKEKKLTGKSEGEILRTLLDEIITIKQNG